MKSPFPKSATKAETQRALDQIVSCEACGEAARTPFYWVVDTVLGRDPTSSARSVVFDAVDCPGCGAPILGDTFVEWN